MSKVSNNPQYQGKYDDVEHGSSSHFGVDLGTRSSSLIGFIANVSNTIIGAGILGLPWAISQTGWALGLILFCIGALVTNFGLSLLSRVADHLGGDQLSFGLVGERAHRVFPALASFLLWEFCLLISIAYLGTAAKYLVSVSKFFAGPGADGWYLVYSNWVLLCFFLLGFPLSFPKKTTVLQYTSSLAIVFILFTTILCIVGAGYPTEKLCETFMADRNMTSCPDERCCFDATTCCIGEKNAVNAEFTAVVSSFPTMLTAFSCAPTFFPLYNDLQNPTMKRLQIGTLAAISSTSIIYLVISFVGYFTFGNSISSNVLESYPLNTEFTVARIGMAFLLSVSYPLLMHPCRDSFIDLVNRIYMAAKQEEVPSKFVPVLYYSTVFVMNGIALVVASQDLSLGTLLNIIGSFSVTSLSFIVPGFYFVLIVARDGEATNFQTNGAYALIVFGFLVMFLNIGLWINDLVV